MAQINELLTAKKREEKEDFHHEAREEARS